MARVMRANVKHLKTFRVSKYKGWEDTRIAAKKWINQILDTLPECQSGTHTTLSENNKSGVVGLRLVNNKTHRKDTNRTYYYWQWNAKWVNESHERRGTSWQINERVSEDDAFVLAYLSLEAQSTDRDAIKRQLVDARSSGRYEEILSKRKMTLDKAKKSSSKLKEPPKKLSSTKKEVNHFTGIDNDSIHLL